MTPMQPHLNLIQWSEIKQNKMVNDDVRYHDETDKKGSEIVVIDSPPVGDDPVANTNIPSLLVKWQMMITLTRITTFKKLL